MISRYQQDDLAAIWSDQSRFEFFLEVELAICKALENENIIPAKTTEVIKKHAKIDVERINELDQTLKHDIIAFCTSVTENIPAKEARFFHYGVTSSDIIDTALSLQIKKSLDLIFESFTSMLESLLKRAQEMKDLPCMGRSHGMYAEPMSFGVKILGHYNEFSRRFHDLKNFYQNELTMQCSGPVGNYPLISPQVEAQVASSLELKVEPLSTQVIPRDRIAKLVQINALLASAIERFCVELRHLHHSDIGELHEGFSSGQKGSSVMPHKKNPISSENLSGIARVLRSHAQIALDNIVLWHERDISHSSAERLYLPDNLGLVLYCLRRLQGTIEKLEFNREKITQKVYDQAVYLSSYYLHQILKQKEDYREDIYKLVQEASFESAKASQSGNISDGQELKNFFFQKIQEGLKSAGLTDVQLKSPDMEEIKKIYLNAVDQIFERSLKQNLIHR